MSTISIRLNEEEKKLFKGYANFTGKKLSELFKTALAEQIEDEFDYKVGVKALEEFKKEPITYSFDEVVKELEIEI